MIEESKERWIDIMQRRKLKLMSIFVIISALAWQGSLSLGTDKVHATIESDSRVQKMLKEINQFRKVSGLKPVVYNEDYAKYAQSVSDENQQRGGELKHSALNVSLQKGDVVVRESLAKGYQPDEAIWAYISDTPETMGHCYSLLMPDKSSMGISFSGSYNAIIAASTSNNTDVADKVCRELHLKSIQEVKDYIWNTRNDGSIPIYRVYNPNSGEHLHTMNDNERRHLVSVGWEYEGISMRVRQTGRPLYRVYNPNTGEHFYTLNDNERVNLQNHGWRYEGIAWSTPYSGVPMYRVYNPNALDAGSHHYTVSAYERDSLVRVGWRDEGVSWYTLE